MKTKLTPRAVAAHSMLSELAAPRPAPISRMRTKISGRVRHRLRLLGGALLLAAAPFGAEADQIVSFMPPAAQASATSYSDINAPQKVTVADVSLFSACPDPDHVRSAKAAAPGAFAGAQAAKGVGQFAVAGGDSEGGGIAEASLWMFVRDPQNRPTVKLSMTFKGFASSGPPDDVSPVTAANFLVSIGNMKGTPSALVDADGCTTKNADSISDWIDSTFQIAGYSRHQLDLYGNVEESSALNFYTNGVLTASKPLSSDPATLTLEAAPGQAGSVIVVRASAGGGGLAVIDPIITAHPDNPDIEIEIRAPDDDTGRRPLDGFTAEDVAALGIDPRPFINLGFLDPSSPPPPPPPPPPPSGDTTPPATSASATPAANASGWSRTSVTVTLSATDNAGGSGVKEMHYALAGAATGSQVASGGSANVTISAEGTTTLTYFAVDNASNQEAAKTLPVRIDRTPPTVTGLPLNCTLWPADNRLVQVASIGASDALSGLAGSLLVTATSNEPENRTGQQGSAGTGRRASAPDDSGTDIVISGGTVQLRAERAESGTGRVYTITATASDLAGNTATETATCTVPHDMRGGHHPRGR